MAKKKKTDDAADGDAPKKKKPIVPIVLILVGLFAGKTFFGGSTPTTPEQMAEQLEAAEKALEQKCAAWNGMTEKAAGESESGTGSHEETTTTEGESHAAGWIELQLIASSGRATVRLASGAGEKPGEKPLPGAVIEMEPRTVNLADGSYLKIGFAIQLAVGIEGKLAKEEGLGARAVDIALDRLQSHTMRDLMPPIARSELKHQIGEEICKAYEGEVLTIYFTEFVMQS